jgi:4-hydroxybenzoate polyprenyltransferase
MEISGIIAAVLWSITSLLVMIQYAPACKNLNWQEQVIVGTVFIIGGPIFAAANVLEAILDCVLPEGWSDE